MTNYDRDCIRTFPTLWADTAEETDPSTPLPGPDQADVVIIGAGYTGLSAAVALAEAGVSTMVIDGGYPGWGGSGRNSGAVIRGFKLPQSGLVDLFGEERGRAMAEFGTTNAQLVYDLIGQHDIRCDLSVGGWLLPAHNKAGLERARARQARWTADGVAGLEMIDRAEAARLLGSESYLGAMIDRACGSLNPLAYSRGLARAALASGARVHGDTPALSVMRQGDGWQIATPRGAIRAGRVLLATNAYSSGLDASLDASIATIHTHIVVTDRLPDAVAESILPEGQAASDSRRILFYWNKTPDNRLLFGSRGTLAGPRSAGDFAHIEKAMRRTYPQIGSAGIAYRWGGRVGLTRDFLPYINEPQPGLWTAHGYCGRGVAMATAYGRLIGRSMAKNAQIDSLPVPNGPAPRLFGHPMSEYAVLAATQLYKLMDLVN